MHAFSNLQEWTISKVFCLKKMAEPPVIVVVGATATGKTDLSVAIARQLQGEVVNADALQVYAGLDIATNKASAEERGDVPHHLLGTVPSDTAITVHECVLGRCAR